MDRSEVKKIAESAIGDLSRRLGVSDWTIALSFAPEPAEDGSIRNGECTRLIDYASAHISLNPEAFADEAGVLRTLRHELIHLVLAPLDLFAQAVERLAMGDSERGVLDRVWRHCIERTVMQVERMDDATAEGKAAVPKLRVRKGA